MELYKNHIDVSNIIGKCSGPCIVIGSGESGQELLKTKRWQDFYSISCNFSQIYFPSPMYAYQDSSFIMRAKNKLIPYRNLGLVCMSKNKKNFVNNKKHIGNVGGFYIKRKKSKNLQWIKSKTLNGNGKITLDCPITGVVATSAAYLLGFSPIILVGFDATPGRYVYLKDHYQHGKKNKSACNKFSSMQHNFLKDNSKELGVINCSHGEFAEQKDFQETLKQYRPNKISQRRIIEGMYLTEMKKHNKRFYAQFVKKKPI